MNLEIFKMKKNQTFVNKLSRNYTKEDKEKDKYFYETLKNKDNLNPIEKLLLDNHVLDKPVQRAIDREKIKKWRENKIQNDNK